MANKRTKYKNITHIPRQIRFILPNGTKRPFKNSAEAQKFFDENYADTYSMEINSTSDNNGEITLNGGEIPEVVVVGKAPATPTNNSSRLSPFDQFMNVKIGNNREANRRYKDKFYRISDWESLTRTGDAAINPSYWDSETYRNFREGNDLAAAFITTPAALYGLGAAYAVPEIAGAMNLYGAYEGLGRLTSKDGVQKTWNHIKNGEWGDAALSAGGDVFDTVISLPVLNRLRQGAQWLGRGAMGETLNQGINRFSPYYTSKFDWRTGRFTLEPRPGVNVPEGAPVKFGATQELSAPTLALPGGGASNEARAAVGLAEQPAARVSSLGAREVPTYGSMNEVADAIESGVLPTNEEIAAASTSRLGGEPARPLRFYGGEEVGQLPVIVNGRPLPPSTIGDQPNPEYYRMIATHFNRPVEDPNGLAVFPEVTTNPTDIGPNPFASGPITVSENPFEDPLPPAPAEVNNVADFGNAVEDFDRGPYEVETPSPSTTPAQQSPFNDIFNDAGFSRDPDTGYYSDRWGENIFQVNDNGTLQYRPSRYSSVGTSLQQSELEPFLRSLHFGAPFLSGNYQGLDDFMIRAGYFSRGGHRLGASFGNQWEFDYRHPTGSSIPVRVRDTGTAEVPGTLRIRAYGQPPMDISSEGLSREGLYNTIDTYLSNLQGRELTPKQTALIQSQFPIQSTAPNGRISFSLNNSADSPALRYDPLTGHVRIRGRGYNQWDGDITDLTQEALQPKRIPEIITSSSLPQFSAISRGTDWGQILGMGGNYNTQIDFGLERPRPTFNQVVSTLGDAHIESPSNHSANMTVYELGRSPSNNFPYLDLPNSVPIIHTNLVPRFGEATLDWDSKKWAGARMADLGRSAKGVDVASTEVVNPTLSRVVSDISAAQNLSELDKYNLLYEVITRPEQYFPSDGNWQDYSLFSYPENAVKGNSQRRFFTEPSLNFRTDGFNDIGLREGSAAAEGSARSFIDFLNANGFKGNLRDTNDQRLIFEWLQKNAPQFYQTIDNKTFIPFPITTVKKKGGKLVKKKFNGKKARK